MFRILLKLTLILTAVPVFAEVEPYTIFLKSTATGGPINYTIPAGKVFIIEHVATQGSGLSTTQIRALIIPDNIGGNSFATWTVKDSFSNSAWVPLEKVVRLKAGERLELAPGANVNNTRYKGLLIDAADLYAANIPVELNSSSQSGGRLLADVKFASPRPRITRIQSGENLDKLMPDASGQQEPGATRDTASVSVDEGTGNLKFLTATAIARQKKE